MNDSDHDEIFSALVRAHPGLGSTPLSTFTWMSKSAQDFLVEEYRKIAGPPLGVRLFARCYEYRPVVVQGRAAVWVKARNSGVLHWIKSLLALPFSFVLHLVLFVLVFPAAKLTIAWRKMRGCYLRVEPDSTEAYIWHNHQSDRPLDYQI